MSGHTITERGGCGATFAISGRFAAQCAAAAYDWRVTHPCPHGNGTKWKARPVRDGE